MTRWKEAKLKMNQKEIWDKIADKWAEYREEPVGEVIDFLKNKKGNVLDLGCGNGRNLCPIKGKIYGTDFSDSQLNYAVKKAVERGIDFEPVIADCCSLPFSDNFFDSAICISTIHCIDEEEKRKKAVEELQRVLKPGAEAMISVWNKEREISKGKKEEMLGFIAVDGKSYKRYYYYFSEEELIALLKSAGFNVAAVLRSDYRAVDSGHLRHNIAVIVRKN